MAENSKCNITEKDLAFFFGGGGIDLGLVIQDPEIESCCRNALQDRRRDLSSQEASLIRYNTIHTDLAFCTKNFNQLSN